MKRFSDGLAVAGIALPLILVAACDQISSVASTASAAAPVVAGALQTICQTLVPAAEATVNALAKGGAAATIQATENNDVAPACDAATVAAATVDSGWLGDLVAAISAVAVPSPLPQQGGN